MKNSYAHDAVEGKPTAFLIFYD